MLCILNAGTVPMLYILNVGTVPVLWILNVGTVPMLCILNVGTVPMFSSSLKKMVQQRSNCSVLATNQQPHASVVRLVIFYSRILFFFKNRNVCKKQTLISQDLTELWPFRKKLLQPTKILITWPVFQILSKIFLWMVTDDPLKQYKDQIYNIFASMKKYESN